MAKPKKAKATSATKPKSRARGAPDPSKVLRKIRSMKKHPWMCEVDVYLKPPGSEPPFELQTYLEMSSSERIIFRNRRRPGFVITFRLHDDLNPGYSFPSDPTEAVWSKAGTACPKKPVWRVFSPYAVQDKGMALVVYNENPWPAIGNFQYSLRVTKDGGRSFLLLDPGGTEMNGPRS